MDFGFDFARKMGFKRVISQNGGVKKPNMRAKMGGRGKNERRTRRTTVRGLKKDADRLRRTGGIFGSFC